jgi:hypothetical protein
VESRIQNPVIFLSSFGDGVFIGLLALFSVRLALRLVPDVRDIFFFHSCAVSDSHSKIYGVGRSIRCVNYLSLYLRTCFSQLGWFIDLLFRADSMLIPNFQHSWPDKESLPESHTYVLLCHCLCVRYGHHSVHYLDATVRSFFMLNTRSPIDTIQSSQSYRYVTSVLWYTSQATAECLISCKPHFSYVGHGAMTHLRSFPCSCTPEGSKWY